MGLFSRDKKCTECGAKHPAKDMVQATVLGGRKVLLCPACDGADRRMDSDIKELLENGPVK